MDNQGYHKKCLSNIQDQLNNINYFIIKTLRDRPYGIEINKLEKELCAYLHKKSYPKLFQDDDFEDFLLNNFEEQLDIQIQTQIRSKNKNQKRKKFKMVYPRIKSSKNRFNSHFTAQENEYGLLDNY